MTIKTNTKLYCASVDRLMSSAEMCAAMVLPSSKAQAARLKMKLHDGSAFGRVSGLSRA